MIVITCNCKVMSRELIADAVGISDFDFINDQPGGVLHLHSKERGSVEQKAIRRQVARLMNSEEYEQGKVHFVFAVHANCPYMYNRTVYKWKPTGELGQLRGLSCLLDDCQDTLDDNNVPTDVFHVERWLYVNEVETGIFWRNFTDLDNTFELET